MKGRQLDGGFEHQLLLFPLEELEAMDELESSQSRDKAVQFLQKGPVRRREAREAGDTEELPF